MLLAIDRSHYTSAPRMSVATGSTLLAQLIDAAVDPQLDPTEALLDSAKELRKLLAKARSVDVAASLASVVPTTAGDADVDKRADRILKAIMLRLQAAALLDQGDASARAAQHLALLYPEGLAFTRGTYAAQDAAMKRMRRLIKQDPELAQSLEELVGPEYLAALAKIAKPYSDMVKAMGRIVPTTVDQRSVLLEMKAAVVQHCSRVLGELRDADPKSVARTRALLAPIDNHRARQTHGSASRASAPVPVAAPEPGPVDAS